MRPSAVFDTNVIVSAALVPGSIPASLVALALSGGVALYLSPAIYGEYWAVLRRPKFGFRPASVQAFLRDLRRVSVMVHPSASLSVSPDEPDNRFLECALAGRVDYLVTGNARDFPGPEYQDVRIVSPAEFAGILIG